MKNIGKTLYNWFLYMLAFVVIVTMVILSLPFIVAGAAFVAIFAIGSIICFIGLIILSAIFEKEK